MFESKACCSLTQTTNNNLQFLIPKSSFLITYTSFLLFFFLTLSLHAQTAPFRYAVIPENARPGEPVTIAVNPAVGAKSAVLLVNGKRLTRAAFFLVASRVDDRPLMAAVLTIPATVPQGRALIAIETAAGLAGNIAITITGREFISEEISLDQALSDLRTKDDPQKTAESEELWAIINKAGKETYCLDNFTPPVSSQRRTGFFGDQRIYHYSDGLSDTSVHAGIDYGVPKGTPVTVCGPGKVMLAKNRIVTGNSVVIEHLPGIFSLYYHLDSIEVSEGALLGAGAQLGRSGATGLATGPHLHWEIRVWGENTDPDAFISRPILDKTVILGKLYGRDAD